MDEKAFNFQAKMMAKGHLNHFPLSNQLKTTTTKTGIQGNFPCEFLLKSEIATAPNHKCWSLFAQILWSLDHCPEETESMQTSLVCFVDRKVEALNDISQTWKLYPKILGLEHITTFLMALQGPHWPLGFKHWAMFPQQRKQLMWWNSLRGLSLSHPFHPFPCLAPTKS